MSGCGTSIEKEKDAAEKLSSFTDSPHGVRAAQNLKPREDLLDSGPEISPSMADQFASDSPLARFAGSEAELLPVSLPANCIR